MSAVAGRTRLLLQYCRIPVHMVKYSGFVQHKLLISGVDSNWRRIHTVNCLYEENIVYCDGSCLRNGQKDAVAGVGVYWSPDSKHNISEPLKTSSIPTNNQAELMEIPNIVYMGEGDITQYVGVMFTGMAAPMLFIPKEAVIRAVETAIAQELPNVTAYTDSQYTLHSASVDLTERKDIPNRDLIVELQRICKHEDIKVTLMLVKAHSNCVGNKMADKLAKDAAKSLL